MGYIYIIRHKISRKAYIGQTIRPIRKRFEEHQLSSSKCRAILGAINKYGWENFDAEWYEIPDNELNLYEEMLVALLGTLAPGGYNLREGGGATGKLSEETKEKISESMTGRNLSKEHKEKMSASLTGEKNPMYGKTGEKNPMYGKTHTKEHKEKMSEAHFGEKNPMYGKTHTKETKEKMSEAKTGEKHPNYGKTGEKHPASKKVYQYTIDGTFVRDFGSAEDAALALRKEDGSSISKCARGDRKSAYGFKWTRETL
jgi:group I intron endonuclease